MYCGIEVGVTRDTNNVSMYISELCIIYMWFQVFVMMNSDVLIV